jgi:hypothetical protein
VLAHVAPHQPEHEWFRRRDDGAYFAPMTSTARWLAGEQGWQLRLAATGECGAAVDVGREPRRIAVSVRRTGSGSTIRVGGVQPPIELVAPHSIEPLLVVLDVAADGAARLSSSHLGPQQATIDRSTIASPPYEMTFVAPRPDNCAVVWWEIKPRA